jgi:hypothetical protein
MTGVQEAPIEQCINFTIMIVNSERTEAAA